MIKINKYFGKMMIVVSVFFVVFMPSSSIVYAVDSWTGNPWEGDPWKGVPWDGTDLHWQDRSDTHYENKDQQENSYNEYNEKVPPYKYGKNDSTNQNGRGQLNSEGNMEGKSNIPEKGFDWWAKKSGSLIAKSGLGYIAYHNGHRLLTVIEGGKVTGYLSSGGKKLKSPLLEMTKKLGRKGKYIQGVEQVHLPPKNHYNSFGKAFKHSAVSKGNAFLSSAVGMVSAYNQSDGDIWSREFLSATVTETAFAWGTASLSTAIGSLGAGSLVTTGLIVGSAVPIAGTIIGGAAGLAISGILSTSWGRKLKNGVQNFFEKGFKNAVNKTKLVYQMTKYGLTKLFN
ncbi:hypothetical protein ACFSUM_07380 [Virgibacillus siamensis]|uniref:hypothetical protein n=1 Tax=Virgibacillus siamensis TaxID=480071 RepID=UPI0031D348A5